MDQPLHTLNPTARFSSRAADYARFRPGYPAEAADAIVSGLGPIETLVAADVGAGTGISARLLASRGIRTIAIEPNDTMREAAEPHPVVEWKSGRAEATGLQEHSIDVVLCAQAFHWFEPQSTLAEFARILKPGGRLALMWNEGDRSDPLTNAYYEAISEASQDQSMLKVRGAPDPFWQTKLFSNQRQMTFGNFQEVDEESLLGRAFSASYVPTSGPAADRLAAQLRSALAAHAPGGASRLLYQTHLFLAERP